MSRCRSWMSRCRSRPPNRSCRLPGYRPHWGCCCRRQPSALRPPRAQRIEKHERHGSDAWARQEQGPCPACRSFIPSDGMLRNRALRDYAIIPGTRWHTSFCHSKAAGRRRRCPGLHVGYCGRPRECPHPSRRALGRNRSTAGLVSVDPRGCHARRKHLSRWTDALVLVDTVATTLTVAVVTLDIRGRPRGSEHLSRVTSALVYVDGAAVTHDTWSRSHEQPRLSCMTSACMKVANEVVSRNGCGCHRGHVRSSRATARPVKRDTCNRPHERGVLLGATALIVNVDGCTHRA
jgi:hypothetical protein